MTSSTDFLNMQLNLRNNQTELADFMSDLQTWEKDIKQKDQAIQSISTPDKLPADLKGEKVRCVLILTLGSYYDEKVVNLFKLFTCVVSGITLTRTRL